MHPLRIAATSIRAKIGKGRLAWIVITRGLLG